MTRKASVDMLVWPASLCEDEMKIGPLLEIPRSDRETLWGGRRGRQAPALIAVVEPAGTAVTLQRHTQVVRPDRHPEFP